MKKSDQPISIIGVLFALSIGFWGNNMVRYIQEEVPRSGYALTKKNIDILIENADVKVIYNIDKFKDLGQDQPVLTGEVFEAKLRKAQNPRPKKKETVEEQPTADEAWATKQRNAHKAIIKMAATLMRPSTKQRQSLEAEPSDFWFSLLIILAGLAFLADIACIMWWYARYIYIIHPTPTLSTHFVDFGVCAAFNLAATAWTDPRVFLTATMFGAGLLLGRFFLLYRSSEASKTDKNILKSAWHWMTIAAVASFIAVSAGAVVILLSEGRGADIYQRGFHPVMLLALSAIGICLTVKFASRIRKSADMHENRQRHFTPMELHWPEELKQAEDDRKLLTDRARSGLDRFRNMFTTLGAEHDRLISRVHAEADLRVQSYILAIPSWKRSENANANSKAQEGTEAKPRKVDDAEVERKAFIVALSHWLDDLLDGREEMKVYRQIENWEDWVLSLDLRENRHMFVQFYRSTAVAYTDEAFYEALVGEIEKSVVLLENLRYLYFGLNRVAIGSVLFSPRLSYRKRRTMLRAHSSMLGQLVASEHKGDKTDWFKSLTALLSEMQVREDGLGHYMLGMTTKTSQEMGMASEGRQVNFALSILYSLLYAPLLYFHDIKDEVEVGEMAALETFDVNYESIINWIERVRELIDDTEKGKNDAPIDELYYSRSLQIEMAFKCFKEHLPQVGRKELKKFYVCKRKPNDVVEVEKGTG